jgi:uncharacterized RDD family membrane protein YckC
MSMSSSDVTQVNNPAPASKTTHPAGFFSRFEAFVIDLFILSVIQVIGSSFIQSILNFFGLTGYWTSIQALFGNRTSELAIGSTLMGLIVILYFVFFWTLLGYTPGKALLGLKVVKKNGEKLSIFRSLLRFFAYWISAIPIFLGFFWVLWDSKRQGWHDKIAGTQVMYIPRKPRK